jgi:ribosomal protein S27AE
MGWGFWIFVWLICGVIAAVISDRKNNGAGSGFALGALLGIIGVIIVACQKASLPPAPAGMRALKCPRCNAVQNIPIAATSLDCWQCHLTAPVQVPPWVAAQAAKASGANKRMPANKAAVAEQPKRVIRCPLCGAEQRIPATAARFKCGKCKEVTTAPH